MKANQSWERGGPPDAAPQKWFENEPKVDFNTVKKDPSNRQLVNKYSAIAEELFAEDVLRHNSKNFGGSRYQNNWMKTIMSKGTMADKVAAQILQVQNSPVHSLSTLGSLINMVKVGKKKECLQVMENLVELWTKDLLRPDSKLTPFEMRPFESLDGLEKGLRDKCLMLWWFEAKLKEQYVVFIRALDAISKESIENIKGKAIGSLSQLLSENPEQEQLILAQLVNKLGDPQQSVASKAIHYLQQVLKKHPNMQPVVLEEVEKMIFRPNIQSKAQYYSICFLIQFHLSLDDKKLATNLINLYFCLFKVCIKKGELESRLLQILLSGVKRAFPYAKDAFSGALSDQLDTLHKLVHVSSFGVALHALCLLHQVAQASSAIEDRFYTSLYKKMLDPDVVKSKHHALFLNIVYKSLKSDTQLTRIQAFIKRLLQIALVSPSNLACSILYLISQAIGKRKELIIVDVKEGETNSSKFEEDDDDEEEKYEDAKLEEEKDEAEEKPEPVKATTSWSWVKEKSQSTTEPNGVAYTPFNRNPLFTKAECVGLRELTQLSNHYHPTVSLFAQNILNKEVIQYTGDILVDFSSSRFLDRFSFKNPKKEGDKKQIFSRTSQYQPKGVRSLRVNSARYINVTEDHIPHEDLFLYRYMQKKFHSLAEEKEKNGDEDNSDNESVQSDEFEELLFGKNKKVDDEEEEEDDIDFAQAAEDAKSKGKGKSKKKKRQLEEDDDDDDFSEDDEDGGRGLPSDFASAEEFAEMLQSAGVEDEDVGSSAAVKNTDNSHAKQLKWEQNREKWSKGGAFKRKQNMPSKGLKTKKRKVRK